MDRLDYEAEMRWNKITFRVVAFGSTVCQWIGKGIATLSRPFWWLAEQGLAYMRRNHDEYKRLSAEYQAELNRQIAVLETRIRWQERNQ